MAEVPWPSEMLEAHLRWPEDRPDIGDFFFVGPDGRRAGIPVTRGDSNEVSAKVRTNVWHIDINAVESIATISPSIHFVGHYHSPNPVSFKLVENSWKDLTD